jgi:acyl-CoA synthetase (NDP forming)
MRALFRPDSIAIVGATDSPEKMGSAVTRRLVEGFEGTLHFVHPSLTALHGRPVHRQLADIGEPVDLAVAVCPAQALQEVVADLPPGRVRYLLAIPGGFGEDPAGGPERQRRLAESARRAEVRIVGPNTAGLLNTAVGLNASLMPAMPQPGPGASFVTQSGGFAMSVMMYSENHQLPVGTICDVGNSMDVHMEDVLEHLRGDEHTQVVGVFVESVRDADRFRAALAELAAVKPVVLTRRGEGDVGARVTHAHLGAAAGEEIDVAGTGVVRTETVAELLHAVKAWAWLPALGGGGRVAIVTGTGGLGSDLADLCLRAGLEVPELSAGLQSEIGAVPRLPSYAPRNNPVDLTPIWWDFPTVYPAIVRRLLDSPEVDAVLVAIQDIPTQNPALAEALARDLATSRADKPVVVFWGSRFLDLPHLRALERARVPCYLTPREAVDALAAVTVRDRP